MLKINDLSKQYKPGRPVFSDINKEFKAGNCIGLIGPNGSGKTTFLRLLSVNSFPTSGSVKYNGVDIHQSPSKYLQDVGLVHDEESLPQHLSASELLQWILRSRSLWSVDSSNQIDKMFDQLALEERNEPIGTYSTGMKKKTQIAAAFVIGPKILILDEPLRGLDVSTRETVFALLNNAKTKNTLILMASHSMGSYEDFFDEIMRFPL